MSSSNVLAVPPIEQPFYFFPQNGISILWAPILGSTLNTTQTPVTDATGTLTCYDPNGDAVPGITSLAFAQTSPGIYEALIDGTAFTGLDADGNPLPFGAGYSTVISMTSVTVGEPGVWTIPTIIKLRNTP